MAALDLAKLSHETLRLGHKEATLNAQIRQFGVRAFDLLGGWPNAENTMRKALILSVAAMCVLCGGVAGVLASGDQDVVHSSRLPVLPDKSASPKDEALAPEVLKPLGEPSPKAEDTTFPMTNATPQGLIEGIFAARARGDKAWLARTLESLAGRTELTQDDLQAGWRQYLWHPELWDKLEAAHRAEPARFDEARDRARVTFNVGGNAGEIFIQLVRVEGAWYLLGA